MLIRAVFNPTEVHQIVSLCQSLLAKKVSPYSIGIITPYRKQVTEIEWSLERFVIII